MTGQDRTAAQGRPVPVESLLDEDDFAVIREGQRLPEGSAAPGSASEAGLVPDTQEGTDGAPVNAGFSPGGCAAPAKRDRLACWLCNQILNRLATPWYRKMVGGSIRYGLLAAAGDERAGAPRRG